MTDNKALEALENVKMALARHLARQVGYVPPDSVETFRNALEADTDLQIIAAALVELDEIKKRAEERLADAPFQTRGVATLTNNLINYILKGEPK